MAQRDVIWITLESTRQDHTSLSEYKRDTTPELADIASEKDTFSFKKCYSHGIWTRASTASILSGRTPSNHGVGMGRETLPTRIETIPEAFSREGYDTIGISANAQFSRATGLDKGFDTFESIVPHDNQLLTPLKLLKDTGIRTTLWFLYNIYQHSGGLTLNPSRHCLNYFLSRLAKEHIKQSINTTSPLFMYVHLSDSHHPYQPPVSWREKFAGELQLSIEEALNISYDMSQRIHKHIAKGLDFSAEEWEAIKIMYDTSVAYSAHVASGISSFAKKSLNDPIVVITSDHGEAFGEKGTLAHMLITDTAVSNVPLLVSGIDISNFSEEDIVQHADVMKTIVEQCDINHRVPIGVDLQNDERQFAIVQRGRDRVQRKLQLIRSYGSEFDEDRILVEDLHTLYTNNHRLDLLESDISLFSLPDESTNIVPKCPDIAQELNTELNCWLDEYGGSIDSSSDEPQFTEGMKRQLEDLGYL